MQEDSSAIILAEIRDLRIVLIATGERLAALETSVTSLIGNGQPGRINKLEEDVSGLQRWRWILAGAYTALTIAVPFILKFFLRVLF